MGLHWKPWFAWHPVRLTHGSEGYWLGWTRPRATVWLRWIERTHGPTALGRPFYRNSSTGE